jgi:hypothetical protein
MGQEMVLDRHLWSHFPNPPHIYCLVVGVYTDESNTITPTSDSVWTQMRRSDMHLQWSHKIQIDKIQNTNINKQNHQHFIMKLYIVSSALVLLTSTTPLVSAALRGSNPAAAEEEAASDVKDETAQLYGYDHYYGNRDYTRRPYGTPWNVQPNGRPWNERPDGISWDRDMYGNRWGHGGSPALEAAASTSATLDVAEFAAVAYDRGHERPDGISWDRDMYGNRWGHEGSPALEAAASTSATLDVAEFAAVAYDRGHHHRRHSRNRRYGPESYKGGYGNQYQQPNSSYQNSPGHQHGNGNQYQSSGNPTQCFNYYDPNTCANRGCTWNANMCHP